MCQNLLDLDRWFCHKPPRKKKKNATGEKQKQNILSHGKFNGLNFSLVGFSLMQQFTLYFFDLLDHEFS